MDILTCECTRVMTPSGQSSLMCQVTSTPSDLKPGSTYTFTCRSEDETLCGRQFRFQWTGSEWRRKKSSVDGGGSNGGHHEKQFLTDYNNNSSKAEKENERNSFKENSTQLQSSWPNRPFSIQVKERESSSSIFSRYNRPLVTLQLDLPRRGFLLGEQLPFQLTFVNVPLTNVRKVTMTLVQKITASIPGKRRETTVTPVTKQEKMSFDISLVKGSKFCWASKFIISKDLRPSLTCDGRKDESVEVCYYLEFTLEMAEGHNGLCGKAPIVLQKGGQKKDHRDLSQIRT